MSLVTDIADGIVDELNGANLSLAFRACRSYADYDEKLPEGELRIDVVPLGVGITTEFDTRGTLEYVGVQQIIIRQKIADIDVAKRNARRVEVDGLIGFTEEVNEHLAGLILSSAASATYWRSVEIEALYVRDHLRELNQYTGLLRVTYVQQVDV